VSPIQKGPKDRRNTPWIDWHINVGNLITLLILVVSAVGAWYDLKSEIKTNKETAEIRFNQMERFQLNQQKLDSDQDARTDRLVLELRSAIHDSTRDVQRDIRDLRVEIGPRGKSK
jgi:hypothetical protein